MPYVEVLMTREYLAEIPKEKIADEIAGLVIEAEGLVDNNVSRSIALVSYRSFDSLFIGGKETEHGKIVVKIRSFAEGLPEEKRKALFRGITDVFARRDPRSAAQKGSNVWCMIEPVGEMEFAVGGVPVTLRMTRDLTEGKRSS